MSLDYGYIFSQIDKAKKKRWTQADTDKWTKQLKEEKEEPKSREQIGESFTRVPGRKRGKQIGGKIQSESSTRVTGRKRGKGKKNLGTEHETRKPEKEEIRRRREAADAKRKQEEKDAKETYTGVKGDFPPASHDTSSSRPSGRVVDINIPKHIKGLGGKKQHHKEQVGTKVVTNLKPKDTVQKKPLPRKSKLRQESGGYAIKDPKEGQAKINEADRKFQKERDTTSITSFAEFLRDRKKNPPASGGFVSAEESDKESETADYKKWVADREASAKKREEDKKERESIDPKTKLPKGPKVKPKPKKEQPKVEEYQLEGDPNPEVEGGIDGDDEYSEYEKEAMKKKSLWKAWLKNKVSMSRMKPPKNTKQEEEKKMEEKMRGRQKLREGTFVPGKRVPGKYQTSGVKDVETREGESYEKFRKRQDAVEDPREHKTLTQQLDDMGVLNQDVEPAPEPATSAPAPKPATSAPKPKPATSGGFIQDINDPEDIANKALWKSWLEKKDCPNCGKKIKKKKRKLLWNFITQPPDIYPSEIEGREDDEEEDEEAKKSLWKAWLKQKAEEGIGGMNMGSQRGLGHEAGYKQDPGQTAQITEVKDKIDKIKSEQDEEGEQSKQRERTRSGQQDAVETQTYTYGDEEHLYDAVRSGAHGHPKHVGDGPGQPKERDIPLSRVEGTSRSSEGKRSPGVKIPIETKEGERKEVTVSQLGQKLGDKVFGAHTRRALRDTKAGKLGRVGTSERRRLAEERGRDAETDAVNTSLAATISAEEAELGKSAYENHEQDESPDSQPNKQQIPPSKPGMDALKSYKKALIIKYNNIYKPANI